MREYCKILNPFKYDVKNAEGIVARTGVELFDKYGNRAITKIQSCDFCPSV